MRRRSNSSADTFRLLRPLTAGAVVWASALAVAAFGQLNVASAQTPHAEAGKAANASATAAPNAAASAAKAAAATKPLWSELNAEQQEALKPLVSHWTAMNAGQKRKWLALSRNFANMATDDRVTLHSRMIEWAALSNQQRAQARLNFAEVKRVPADERKAKWEQYQALSEEEKRKLAERAPAKPRGAAVPIRPVSSQKLVPVPAVTPPGQHTPRIVLAPSPMTSPAAGPLAPSPNDRTPAASAASVSAPASRANVASPPVPAEAQVPAPAPVPAAEQLPSAP